ncbi:MAG: hypothetical protein QM785_08255 [Pyrinomonadaceae bacterium]
MKIRTIVVCLTVFLSTLISVAGARAQGGDTVPPKSTSKVNVKYDKGKDLTTISLKSMTITRLDQEKTTAGSRGLPVHQMAVEGSFAYNGAKEVKSASLRFFTSAGNYIFLKPQEVTVAIDRENAEKGRAFSLGLSSYRSNPPKFNTVFEEFFDLAIPADAIRKFAVAETLEFYVGPASYKLTPKQIEAFKEWETFLPKESK